MEKQGLYYRRIEIEICEDVDGELSIFMREDTDERSRVCGITGEDYAKIFGLIHNFDQRFKEKLPEEAYKFEYPFKAGEEA